MRLLILLVVAVVMGQFDLGSATAAENKAVTLGAVYDLTGDGAAYGIPSSRGAQLFVDHINNAGGVLGHPLTLIIKDAESDNVKTAAAVRAILSEDPDVPALFGLSESEAALAAGAVAAAAQRMFLTSGATSPKLPAEVPGYLFLACFGDNVQAAAAAEFAYDRLKARSAAILYDARHTYTKLLQGYFKNAFETLGGEVSSLVPFDGPGGLAAVMGEVTQADILFLAAETPPDALQIVRALRAKGFGQPIIGGDGYDGERVWPQDPSLSDIYYTTHGYFGDDHLAKRVVEFTDSFMQKFDGERPDGFAGLGYDAVGLLAHAIRRAGSGDPEKVRATLAATKNYTGVTGTISFVNGSHVPLKSVTIIEVHGGRRHFVEQLLPKSVPEP